MSKPQVHAFPRSDDTFVRFVHELFERLQPPDPDVLATHVRASYPSARIVPQSRLGALGEPIVWYAYRDGGVVSDDHPHYLGDFAESGS